MKHRVNISIDPINWVYARANKINLSQLLNDILREMRHKRDEEKRAIESPSESQDDKSRG